MAAWSQASSGSSRKRKRRRSAPSARVSKAPTRPLIVANGMARSLPQGRVATERDAHVLTIPNRSAHLRGGGRDSGEARGSRDDRCGLPPTVHGARRARVRRPRHRPRAREGRLPLHRRRAQPLAGRASDGRGAASTGSPSKGRSGGGPFHGGRRGRRCRSREIATVIGRQAERPGRLAVAASKRRQSISAGSPASRPSTARPPANRTRAAARLAAAEHAGLRRRHRSPYFASTSLRDITGYESEFGESS